MGVIYLDDAIWQRVQKLADRKCMSVHKLCSLYIEMAVTWEELQAHDTAVGLLDEVLTKLIKESPDEIQSDRITSPTEARPLYRQAG